MNLADALAASPIVAILRGIRPEEALEHAHALFEAGVRAVETPLNSPDPLRSIRLMADALGDRMTIGAGTVLAPERAQAVADAGGRIVVSPNTDPAVIARARDLGLDPIPGFATATEAFAAYGAGARHLKLFPAATSGPAHLRQLKAVLPPDAVIWAVGGVGPETMSAWWTAGARGFGLGGELYRAGQPAQQTFRNATRAVAAAKALIAG